MMICLIPGMQASLLQNSTSCSIGMFAGIQRRDPNVRHTLCSRNRTYLHPSLHCRLLDRFDCPRTLLGAFEEDKYFNANAVVNDQERKQGDTEVKTKDAGGLLQAKSDDMLSTRRRGILQSGIVGAASAMAARCIPSAEAADIGRADAATSDGLSRMLEERAHEFVLPNGLRFLCYERRSAPVVSFFTYADVGAYDEPDGWTGVAHLLEHMAFKGTPRVGTTDYRREMALLDAMDSIFYDLIDTKAATKRAMLESKLQRLQEQASGLQIPNEYGRILSREGAVGLNAATTHDSTTYMCSLPSNKLELWFALESERFRYPVFRELYSEKKVVFEERRLRVDNSPLGPFQEAFSEASLTNNYRRPVIGYAEDLRRIGRRELASFFESNYGPWNITIVLVGDVNPDRAHALADQYFGDWKMEENNLRRKILEQGHSLNINNSLNEPLPKPSNGSRMQLQAQSPAGPAVFRAWYRPSVRDMSASIALDAVNDMLTGSRTSRLQQKLVQTNKALACTSFPTYPAEKHPCQMSIYVVPSKGYDLDSLDGLLCQEIDRLVEGEGPSSRELMRYSAGARSGILQVLQNNASLAAALASYQVLSGSWKNLPLELQQIERLTPRKVMDRAGLYLNRENSFVGYILPENN